MNKKTCIGIIARCGSSRLYNKHLKKILDQPIIYYLIQRIKFEFSEEIKKGEVEISILTGSKEKNHLFEVISKANNILTFFGDDHNIPKRILKVMEESHYNSMIVVEGDDIFCSTEGMRSIFHNFAKNNNYLKTLNYPFGMNSMGLGVDYLSAALERNKNKNLETGWTWIFDEKDCLILDCKDSEDKRLRFTLDYEEDFEFFKQLILSDLDPIKANTLEIVECTLENEFYKTNISVSKKYWKNFYKLQENEINENFGGCNG